MLWYPCLPLLCLPGPEMQMQRMSLTFVLSMQAEFARVPLADTTVVPVHDSVTDIEALMLGDILPTGIQRPFQLLSSDKQHARANTEAYL